MARAKRNGRSKYKSFVMLERYMLNSEAYLSLHVAARALIPEFGRIYNGTNNGSIGMGRLTVEKRLHCGKRVAERALNELLDRGFLEITYKGMFTIRRATEYRLTWLPTKGLPATKEFMCWGKEYKQIVEVNMNHVRGQNEPCDSGTKTNIGDYRGQDEPYGPPLAASHMGQNEPTYSIPRSGNLKSINSTLRRSLIRTLTAWPTFLRRI